MTADRAPEVTADLDPRVLFATLQSAMDLRRVDLGALLNAVRGNAKAERELGNLTHRLDVLFGMLFMLGATDVEPEDEVLAELKAQGLATRRVPHYAGIGDEAGDHASEE